MKATFLKNKYLFFVMCVFFVSSHSTLAYNDLITILHPDNTTTGFNSLVDTDVSRGTALLNAVAAAENGDSLYLAAGIFDIQNNSLSLKKDLPLSQKITPVLNYGVGAGYNYIANGTGYAYRIYALIDGEWVLSRYSDQISDDGSNNDFYISITWDPVPLATLYRVNMFTDDQGSWFQYHTTADTFFNDGDGTEDDFVANNDIQLAPTGSISIHGAGKYTTQIKSSISGGSYILQLGSNSETTDLSIIATSAAGTYAYPYGDTSEGFTGSLIKNVYISGQSDGIFVANSSLPTDKHLIVINVTIDTTYDVFNWFSNQEVYIYNSTINAISVPGNYGQNHSRGLSVDGIVHAFNTSINVQGSTVENIGAPVYQNGLLNMYGGSITTAGTGAIDVDNTRGGEVNFTDSVVYDPLKVSGPISSLSAISPIITHVDPTSIMPTSVVLNAFLLTDGGSEVFTQGFEYGLSDEYGTDISTDGLFNSGDFSEAVSGLSCETVYHYRAYAMNDIDITYSIDRTFITATCPVDTTDPIISLISSIPSTTSATITWTTNEASSSIIDYGTTTSYGTTTTEADTSPRVTSHSLTITGLSCGTIYYYKVSSTDASSNTGESSGATFITTSCTSYGSRRNYTSLPTTTTQPVITNPILTPVVTTTLLTKTLKLNMTDRDVKVLQVFLNTHGFTLANTGAGSPGKETNYFGSRTYAAVKKFQKAYGLKVDGIVGPKTRGVINGFK